MAQNQERIVTRSGFSRRPHDLRTPLQVLSNQRRALMGSQSIDKFEDLSRSSQWTTRKSGQTLIAA